MLSHSEIQQWVAQARAHHVARELDAAEVIYRRLLEVDPDNAELLYTLGLLLQQKGDIASAVEYLREAIGQKPSYPDAYYHLGNCLAESGRVDEAIERYHKAIELGFQHALVHRNLGMLLIRSGRFEEASVQHRKAIQMNPGLFLSHLNLGIALRELGRYEEAVAAIEKATAIAPNRGDAFAQLGLCLSQMGRQHQAVQAFGRAYQLSPDDQNSHDNYSIVLRVVGRFDEAIDISKSAVKKFPDQASCHFNLAHAYAGKKDWDQGREAYLTAISLNSEMPSPYYMELATTLLSQGRRDDAIHVLETAKSRVAASEPFEFVLASLGVGDTPSAPPPSHVIGLFNEIASSFDRHLVDLLHYVGHQLVYESVLAAAPLVPLDILDLGCGTGLCGVLFKPMARRLIGIDLAPNMVQQARARNVYDEVTGDDLTSALLKRPGSLDLVLAADVFIYVGSLDQVFPAAARALRPGGLMAFTIESAGRPGTEGRSDAATPSQDFVLHATRRYAHSHEYIERLASNCGFDVVSVKDADIRMEADVPVAGKVFLLRVGKTAG